MHLKSTILSCKMCVKQKMCLQMLETGEDVFSHDVIFNVSNFRGQTVFGALCLMCLNFLADGFVKFIVSRHTLSSNSLRNFCSNVHANSCCLPAFPDDLQKITEGSQNAGWTPETCLQWLSD